MNFKAHIKHLKVLVKWQWWWSFTCAQFIWILKSIFSSSHGKWVLVLPLVTAFILKGILLQGFCPSKIEIARFSIAFRLTPNKHTRSCVPTTSCKELFSKRNGQGKADQKKKGKQNKTKHSEPENSKLATTPQNAKEWIIITATVKQWTVLLYSTRNKMEQYMIAVEKLKYWNKAVSKLRVKHCCLP